MRKSKITLESMELSFDHKITTIFLERENLGINFRERERNERKL